MRGPAPRHQGRLMPATRPLWAYLSSAFLGVAAIALIAGAPFLAPPRAGRITGIVFGRAGTPGASIDAVAQADPAARLVDIRWGGRLLYVVYADPAFPQSIKGGGALHLFDAVAAGCHPGTTTAALR